jgi:hypothetical protein
MTEPTPIRKRQYTKRQRGAVVGMAEVMGVRPAARKAHVPESTIRRWRENPDVAQMRAEKHDEVVADVWSAFQMGVKRIIELIPESDDLSKVAVATGIIYDKLALMSGAATTRSEHRDVTDSFDDEEWGKLKGLLREAADAAV